MQWVRARPDGHARRPPEGCRWDHGDHGDHDVDDLDTVLRQFFHDWFGAPTDYPRAPEGLNWDLNPIAEFDKWLYPAYLNLFHELQIRPPVDAWITANQAFVDAVNQPFVEVFGRTLIGDGIQIGAVDPVTGTVFDGVNHSLLGSFLHLGTLHDGGFLYGDGAAGLAGGAPGNPHDFGLDGGPAGLFGNGGDGGGRGGGIPRARRDRRQRRCGRIRSGRRDGRSRRPRR